MIRKSWQLVSGLFFLLSLFLLKLGSTSAFNLPGEPKAGRAAHVDQYQWQEVSPLLPDEHVADCQFVAVDDGWLVTDQGSILRWNGTDWKPVQSAGLNPDWYFVDIDVLAPDSVWLAGWEIGGEQSIILHWDGSDFQSYQVKADAEFTYLNELSMLSDQLGFASGSSEIRVPLTFIANRVFYRWDGQRWAQAPFPRSLQEENIALSSIEIVSPSEGWAAEDGRLFFWDGKNWLGYDDQLAPFSLFRIIHQFEFLSADNGWAVGQALLQAESDDPGIILHWDGKSWSKAASASHVLFALDMVLSDEGWAVGKSVFGVKSKAEADNVVLHWNGSQWNEVAVPTSDSLDTICAYDSTFGWLFGGHSEVVGDQTIYKPIWLRLIKSLPANTPGSYITPSTTLAPPATHTPVPTSTIELQTDRPLATTTKTTALPVENGTMNFPFATVGVAVIVVSFVLVFLFFRAKLIK